MRRKLFLPKTRTVSFGFYSGRGKQQRMEVADQHNDIELNYIEKGEMVFRRGIQTITLSQGDAIVYWATIPHQVIDVSPDTEISWVIIPLEIFLSWKLPISFCGQMLGEKILHLKCMSTQAPFSDWAKDFSSKSSEIQLAAKLEIEAYFRRLSAQSSYSDESSIPKNSSSEKSQSRHVEKMIRFISEKFHEPLTVPLIARAAGLNAEYAMRLFRSRWGITLWAFLLQFRVAEARRRLLLSDATLAEIAFACGFQSLSRFYDAFKRQCHCSPGAYRKFHIR